MVLHLSFWLANVTTDGSTNLTGKNIGLLKRIQERVKEDNPEQEDIFLHCKSVLQLDHVVKPVVEVVNFVGARRLHHQVIKFLEETDSDHQDLLHHSNVRWLSLGKVRQRVLELKQEIISFMELLQKADDVPELSDTDCLCDLSFVEDVLTHMNELNVKLQGKDQFVHEMYTNVRTFKTKLALFSKQMSNKSFAHFPTLATLKDVLDMKTYRKSLDDLHGEFCHRFSDFGKIDKNWVLLRVLVWVHERVLVWDLVWVHERVLVWDLVWVHERVLVWDLVWVHERVLVWDLVWVLE
ncbi:general transcription factor II-I repeat domain-containing protein 2B-like [Embiotoca jacksoni]|uniref:general transcription factor II-I repeat domain-containing protein 2B-like n=1 Tax=Embiotoca jacksoni TaxID=100190 RepID=UPI0037046E7A